MSERGIKMKNGKIKMISAFILAAAVIGTAMSGCGTSKRASDASSTGTAGGASTTAASAATKDTFTFAQGADPRGLDPALVDDGESAKIMCNIYEGLLKYNKDSTQVEPCLAESYEISSDGTKYTFHLRKGVKFQDGADFNADAVKKSIDRQLEPKVTDDMPYASFVFGSKKGKNGVKEVKAVDANTIEIDLFSPETPFVKNVAMVMAAPIVSPTALEKYNNNLNEHPIGTGPYTFVSWDKGQNVKLKRNENYWGEKAKVENVVFRFIKENSARDVALTSGEVDAIDGISASDVPQITSSGDKIFTSEGMTINYMAYNVNSAKFKSAEARKAFSQAVNVSEMCKSLYKDYATVATSIMPTFMNAGSSTIKQTSFDKNAAKAGLAKAGITSINMITYSNPRPYNPVGGQVLAEAIQGYLKDVGVTCNIKTYDWTTYKSIVKKGDYDICFYGWTGDNGDPDNFMNLLDNQDPSMNVAHYNNADYHALIAKGLTTKEGAERNKIYTQCEQKVADENVWLVISHAKNLAAYSPKVSGFYYHQTGITPFAGVTVSK
jgi:peptide/nickel transport system substrate-binding protein